jgi:hypothetical protein
MLLVRPCACVVVFAVWQLQKKLKQIDALKREDAASLDDDQKAKVASEGALLAEVAALEAIVKG